jgi:hypothetical protein
MSDDGFGFGVEKVNTSAGAPATEAAVPVVQSSADNADADALLKDREMVKIYIDEEKDLPNYVFLSHNGNAFRIQRGVEVEVPVFLVDILRNAVAHRVVQKKISNADGSPRMVTELKPYHRYPWHLIN